MTRRRESAATGGAGDAKNRALGASGRPESSAVVSGATKPILPPQTLVIRDFPNTEDARALSPNGRAHWATKRAARKEVASRVVIAATQQPLRAFCADRVRLTFRYVFPDRRKRDVDNLTTGVTKACIDALVRGRWLVADDSEHVVGVTAVPVVEKGQRRLEIVIEPVGERP